MTKRELAISYFKAGYNCTQSVVLAFKEYLKDPDEILKVASPFGGGMSRMRETCGAASAIVLILGAIEGYSTPETGEKKIDLYTKTQKLLIEFEEKFGSLTCRTLLNLTNKHDIPIPEKRSKNFYQTRPCCQLIGGAADILEKYLKEEKLIK